MARPYEGRELSPNATTRVAVDDQSVERGLAAYMSRKLGEPIEIRAFKRHSSGFSWITYGFLARDSVGQQRKLILRVGPPNGLFAPYSVLPQVHALQAVAGKKFPAPQLVSFAEDGAEIGFPFFICTHVEGAVATPWAGSALDGDHRRIIAKQFIEILAALHCVDWTQTPLAPAAGASPARIELQPIATWRKTLARPTARYYPLLDWGGRWLEDHCPVPPRVTIVHGDYRIGNFLEQDQKITAILDWELTHIGDPHEDLGWALLPTFNAGSRKFYGVMERQEVIDIYQNASGIELSPKSLAFYEAFALYQAAGIQMCAVHAFEVGRFNDMRMAAMATQMASMVRAFDRALEAAA